MLDQSLSKPVDYVALSPPLIIRLRKILIDVLEAIFDQNGLGMAAVVKALWLEVTVGTLVVNNLILELLWYLYLLFNHFVGVYLIRF